MSDGGVARMERVLELAGCAGALSIYLILDTDTSYKYLHLYSAWHGSPALKVVQGTVAPCRSSPCDGARPPKAEG